MAPNDKPVSLTQYPEYISQSRRNRELSSATHGGYPSVSRAAGELSSEAARVTQASARYAQNGMRSWLFCELNLTAIQITGIRVLFWP